MYITIYVSISSICGSYMWMRRVMLTDRRGREMRARQSSFSLFWGDRLGRRTLLSLTNTHTQNKKHAELKVAKTNPNTSQSRRRCRRYFLIISVRTPLRPFPNGCLAGSYSHHHAATHLLWLWWIFENGLVFGGRPGAAETRQLCGQM